MVTQILNVVTQIDIKYDDAYINCCDSDLNYDAHGRYPVQKTEQLSTICEFTNAKQQANNYNPSLKMSL